MLLRPLISPYISIVSGFATLVLSVFNFSCKEKNPTTASVYHYIKPQYDLVEIEATTDTLHFPLSEDAYNNISAINIFYQNGKEFISFFDARTKIINLYDFHSQQQVSRIPIKRFFSKHKFHGASVYVKNLDSIFVSNNTDFYLFDSAGANRKSVKLLERPANAWGIVSNITPPILKNNRVFIGVRPYVKQTSITALKEWKVLYGFDLNTERAALFYHLPEVYQKNLYGFHLLEYSYCLNDRQNFVFSFASDSTIYETNLTDFHTAYLGRSQLQQGIIPAVSKEDLSNDKGYKNYLFRDSYGPIYFDHYAKRYLRIAKNKITKADYDASNRQKKLRVIVLDEHLRIIGESPIDSNILVYTIFFSHDGNIYARVNAGDEYAVHFVRLAYHENKNNRVELTKNEKK